MKIDRIRITIVPWQFGEGDSKIMVEVCAGGKKESRVEVVRDDDFASLYEIMTQRMFNIIKERITAHGGKG